MQQIYSKTPMGKHDLLKATQICHIFLENFL